MSLAQTLPGQKKVQSTLPSARLIVTSQARRYQFLIQWKEVRHRRAAPRTEKNGTVLGQKQSETQRGTERRGNVGVCGGRSEQMTKKTSSGWGTSELARAGQRATCSSQTNKQDPRSSFRSYWIACFQWKNTNIHLDPGNRVGGKSCPARQKKQKTKKKCV